MSRLLRGLRLCSVSLAVLVCSTSAFLITRAAIERSASVTPVSAPISGDRDPRNIVRQPEALRLGQRLGKRLGPSSRAAAVVGGRVTTGGGDQLVTITRRETRKGEDVELVLNGRALRWNAQEGVQAVSTTETERVLFERIIFDSPDYFVLAQLHGAGYFTVARNVRPPGVPDDYSGPLWTIVRVDEPQTAVALQPTSPWRLFYINSATGLIDRIVSRLGDETVEALISSWTEQSGEKVPAQITWSIAGRPVMSYQATSFSHNE